MAYNPLVDTSDPMTILLSASYLHFRYFLLALCIAICLGGC